MKKQSFFSRITAYVLTLCMLVCGFGNTNPTTVSAAESTTVYFFNSDGWSQVYAYVYANDAAIGTAWPGDAAVSASEIGNNWWKTTVVRDAAAEPCCSCRLYRQS